MITSQVFLLLPLHASSGREKRRKFPRLDTTVVLQKARLQAGIFYYTHVPAQVFFFTLRESLRGYKWGKFNTQKIITRRILSSGVPPPPPSLRSVEILETILHFLL